MKRNLFLTTALALLTLTVLWGADSNKGKDPRIQAKNNKVTIALLNLDNSVYTVQIFSSTHKLIHQDVLENDAHLAGKTFDFGHARKDRYQISVKSKNGTVLDSFLFLGR